MAEGDGTAAGLASIIFPHLNWTHAIEVPWNIDH
jgi:hypothetical protein